jgi:molybdopterin-guanine dinucleotide biosynthesis protein A
MIADCTAIILAGGESKRMGRDKAALPFDGATLMQSVIANVSPLFAQTLVSVRQLRVDVALPQICDRGADGGPLVGLISTLDAVSTPWAFVVACDMPFVAPALVTHLASLRAEHQAVVPQVNEHAQPLAAFYARAALPLLQRSLAGGNKSVIGALKSLDVRYVEADELLQYDPSLRSFFDLDTPQDYQAALK